MTSLPQLGVSVGSHMLADSLGRRDKLYFLNEEDTEVPLLMSWCPGSSLFIHIRSSHT